VKTFSAKPQDIERKWFVVDAQGQTLGRMATRIATILRGKHKPIYTPHMDCGDYVIVVNADKIHVTGQKLEQKTYYRHSGYPGGLRQVSLRRQLQVHRGGGAWYAAPQSAGPQDVQEAQDLRRADASA